MCSLRTSDPSIPPWASSLESSPGPGSRVMKNRPQRLCAQHHKCWAVRHLMSCFNQIHGLFQPCWDRLWPGMPREVLPRIWLANMEYRWIKTTLDFVFKCDFIALIYFQCDSFVSAIGHLCPQNGGHPAKCENVLMKFGICVQHFPCSAELLVERKMLSNEKPSQKAAQDTFSWDC